MNPLGHLITKRISQLQISKSMLVAQIGYTNINKGMRRLNSWINGEYLPDAMEEGLAKGLQIEYTVLKKAIEATLEYYKVEKEEYEIKERKIQQAIFRPHICAICEKSVPSPIIAGNMTHARRFVNFDSSFLELSENDKLAAVKKEIISHFLKNEGCIPAFGGITHYVLRRDYDEKFENILLFDICGIRIVNPETELRRYPGRPGGLFLKKGIRKII